MNVTVAICTWNRADLLEQTLTHMQQLRVPPGLTWELLVVNNNCSDHTDEVIERHKSNLPIRCLFEAQQGLSNARNCGLDAARGEWILWTDDDVLVDPAWLEGFERTANGYPHAAAIGGVVLPWFVELPDPDLCEAFPLLKIGYCGVNHGAVERELAQHEEIFGANMAFRLAAIRGLRFDPLLGRCGTTLKASEDTMFVRAVRETRGTVVWSPYMRLRHYVDPARTKLTYIRKFIQDTAWIPDPNDATPKWFGSPRHLWRSYVEALAASWYYRVFGPRRAWLCALVQSWRLRATIKLWRNRGFDGYDTKVQTRP